MKKLLFLILVLFTVNITFSQINTNVSLKCQIYASSGTAPTFNVQSLVSDELSKYDGSSVAAGDKLFIIDGSECYELHISSITLGSGSVLNFVAYDSTGVLTTIPNGQAAVIRKYSIQQVPFIPAGLRSDLASCILQKIASTVNSVTGGSGAGNCIKTITQTAHGFSEGDVLFWDTDEYVNLEGNYTGAEVPLYVVTDSLTVNTFAAASCGEIDSDFGLADGLYYATNTGLELAPEEIEYPAVVVYGSKSKIVMNYGLEFDATGKPLFDVLTSTGNHNFVGGQTLPLISDSIAVSLDTVAGVAVYNLTEALVALENATPSGVVIGSGTVNAVPKFTDTDEIGNSGAVTNNDNFHFPERVTIGSTTLADTSANILVVEGVNDFAEFRTLANSTRHKFANGRYDISNASSSTALIQSTGELLFEPSGTSNGVLFITNILRYIKTNQWYSNINGFFLKDGTTTGWRTGTAVFQIDDTTKGFLGPRMTTAQRTAISVAAADAGLQVYDTDFQALMYYNGTIWTGTRYNGTKFQGFDGTNWVDLN